MIEEPPVKFPGSLFTRKQGFASIFVVIDVAGAPAEPQVVCSSNEKFELASLEAILATKFAPATQDGRPVEETAIIPFDFKIR
jgi:outer membrane biosynthesis protein TonB